SPHDHAARLSAAELTWLCRESRSGAGPRCEGRSGPCDARVAPPGVRGANARTWRSNKLLLERDAQPRAFLSAFSRGQAMSVGTSTGLRAPATSIQLHQEVGRVDIYTPTLFHSVILTDRVSESSITSFKM